MQEKREATSCRSPNCLQEDLSKAVEGAQRCDGMEAQDTKTDEYVVETGGANHFAFERVSVSGCADVGRDPTGCALEVYKVGYSSRVRQRQLRNY